jgi:hypothetical protein
MWQTLIQQNDFKVYLWYGMHQYFILFYCQKMSHSTFYFIHWLMDTWVVFTLGLLWIQTFMHKTLVNMFLILLGVYPEENCLVTWDLCYIAFWNTCQSSPKQLSLLQALSSTKEFQFLHILTPTCYCLSFLLQPSSWVWSCVSPFPWWLMELSITSSAWWTFVHLFGEMST